MVKKPKYKKILVTADADTADIMRDVLAVIRDTNPNDIKDFIRKERIKANFEGLHQLWDWVKQNVVYKEDDSEDQAIQTANYTYWERNKGTDCKSFTVFMCKCFEVLNIPYTVRFAAYSHSNGNFVHVYPIAHLKGSGNVIMDAVWTKFNSQKKYTKTKDFKMAQTYNVSGTQEVGNIVDWVKDRINKLKSWFKDKTINKVSMGFIHAFYPFVVTDGTKSAGKIKRSKKGLEWILKNSPMSRAVTLEIIRRGIYDHIKATPEDFWYAALGVQKPTDMKPTQQGHEPSYGEPTDNTGRRGLSGAIGCVDPITCVALITGVCAAILPLVKVIVNKGSGAEITKEDMIPNTEEMKADTKLNKTEANNQTDNSGGGNEGSNGTPEKDNTMMYLGLAAVGAFVLLKK